MNTVVEISLASKIIRILGSVFVSVNTFTVEDAFYKRQDCSLLFYSKILNLHSL